MRLTSARLVCTEKGWGKALEQLIARVNTVRTRLVWATAVSWGVFHIYTGFAGSLVGLQQRAIHFGFAMVMLFLWKPLFRPGRWYLPGALVDLLLVAASLWYSSFVLINEFSIVTNPGFWTPVEIWTAGIGVFLGLEACRRSMGWALPIIASAIMAYAKFGADLPGGFGFPGVRWDQLLPWSAFTQEGLLGVAMSVSATFLVLFVLFAAALRTSGMGDFLVNLAYSLFGWTRGGPAKAAVVASGLFGTISGSAVANIGATGSFTIPLMIRTGVRPAFAAGVEASASTGGQIMPPIMGTAAFIMASLLDVPYAVVVKAAVIPALLLYVSMFLVVDLEAASTGLVGVPRSKVPNVLKTLSQGWFYIVPIGVLLVLLMVAKVGASRAAVWSLASLVAVSWVNPKNGVRLPQFFAALKDCAETMVTVVGAVAAAGLVIGAVGISGLGLQLSSMLVRLSGGDFFTLLVLTMLASIVLGMGLPTVSTYLILAILVAPALAELGMNLLAAHMFVFFFGIFAVLTPPVAIASYVAAGMASAPPIPTCWAAIRLSLVAFLLPFMFAYNPALLAIGSPAAIAQAVFFGLTGVVALAIGLQGYWRRRIRWPERILYLTSAVLMVVHGLTTDLIGLGMLVALAAWHLLSSPKLKADSAPSQHVKGNIPAHR